jgi:putative spermidine/putrescine transport system substrate-binding protein
MPMEKKGLFDRIMDADGIGRRGFLTGAAALGSVALAGGEARAAKLNDDLTTGPQPPASYPAWFPGWDDIEKAAKKEGRVAVTAWGSPSAQQHFSKVCQDFTRQTGITAQYTHGDWFSAQQKILGEVKAKKMAGDIDCIFLWGQPFANLLEGGGVWEVPFLDLLPNARKIAYRAELGRFVHDMVPTYGAYVPHVNWQDCFVYNKKKYKRSDMPDTVDGVLAWARKHPGEFTYCDPNKGGSGHTWVMQLIYAITGGYEKYAFKPFRLEETKNWDVLWTYLNDLKKVMYKPGTFPQGNKQVSQLFCAGEITFTVNWNSIMSEEINAGACDPAILGMYVPKPSICSPSDGFTVPFNAPHKAAALVFMNYLTSIEVQKQVATTMGSYPVVTDAWEALPEKERTAPYQPERDLRRWRDLGTIYARHGKYMYHMMTEWIDRVARKA